MNDSKRFAPLLWFLTLLFFCRVAAQLILLNSDIPGFPDFEQWHSGSMPYSVLLLCQIVILFVLTKQTMKFAKGDIKPSLSLGRALWVLGLIYLLSMLLRLILGLTVMTESRWFTNHIPTFFHLVLAGFVLLVGSFHQQRKLPFLDVFNQGVRTLTPWCLYPLIMIFGLLLHFIMLDVWQVNLLLATYMPIVISGLMITELEWALPYKRAWQPNAYDIKNDALYMILVQVLLPKLIVPAMILLCLTPLQNLVLLPTIIWPQHWPIGVQAILMVLVADFLRYWLHRLAHSNPYLWRLHAVHHSPDKLYWFNVGRFHPLEKVIQMLFDVLPFLLLGVSEQVISVYIVFYSINGFFQHCNIRLKFGWLNYLISSAQLHRWHHSKKPQESNTNYGNNLIIWDIIFGSYFLPKQREINILGIIQPDYPMDFLKQMKTPFTRNHVLNDDRVV